MRSHLTDSCGSCLSRQTKSLDTGPLEPHYGVDLLDRSAPGRSDTLARWTARALLGVSPCRLCILPRGLFYAHTGTAWLRPTQFLYVGLALPTETQCTSHCVVRTTCSLQGTKKGRGPSIQPPYVRLRHRGKTSSRALWGSSPNTWGGVLDTFGNEHSHTTPLLLRGSPGGATINIGAPEAPSRTCSGPIPPNTTLTCGRTRRNSVVNSDTKRFYDAPLWRCAGTGPSGWPRLPRRLTISPPLLTQQRS
jgi:hypothetical protein